MEGRSFNEFRNIYAQRRLRTGVRAASRPPGGAAGVRIVRASKRAPALDARGADAYGALLHPRLGMEEPPCLYAVAVYAAKVTGLAGHEVDAAMTATREHRADRVLVDALARLSSELDESAFELRDHADELARENATGTASDEDSAYVSAFGRARAAAALAYALGDDPSVAVLDGVYEAYAAVGHIAELRRVIDRALGAL